MIYLDNAATSFPKPDAVASEILNCLKNYGGNPGRSGHALSVAAAEKVFECRERAASLFRCPDPERVIFTLNATHAINMLIKGALRQGDHVLISDLEHNSVYRPVYRLSRDNLISYDIFPTFTLEGRRGPAQICAAVARMIRPDTRLLIVAHSSNICSSTLPLRELGQLCRRRGILFAVDAAQSAGHLEIDMERMCIDALCLPAHKGLLGPMGSGMLLLGRSLNLDTLNEGGNGVNSLDGEMPDAPPERYEAGTLALPAIAGLCEGLKIVAAEGTLNIRAHTERLWRSLREMLSSVKGVTVYAPGHAGAVLLFNVGDIPSDILCRELDRRGLCLRGGFHCSPLGHRTLMTPASGAVRASFGLYNTNKDIEALWKQVKDLAK